MQLISSDKETVTIQMDWQEEFDPILAALTAVNQNYEIVDYLLHELSKEEVAAIQSNLANIKDSFCGKRFSAEIEDKQLSRIQVVAADQKMVTMKMFRKQEFLGIFGLLSALDVKYELTEQEVDPKIPNLTRTQLFAVDEAWWSILKQLNSQYNV